MVPISEEAIDLILRNRNERGYVDEAKFLKNIIYTPGAQYSIQPGMHWGLGVPEGQGYVRVTSPLRRYGDLLAHWQIQQALLQEKEGRPVKGAFDLGWMENFAGTLGMKDHYLKATHRRHNRFWSLLYIKRWQELFADGKNRHLWPKNAHGQPIEDPLQDLVAHYASEQSINLLTLTTQTTVQIPKLGLKELLKLDSAPGGGGGEGIGHLVSVKIQEIRLGVKPLMVLEPDKTRRL
jgi:hypothetical protein